MTSCTASYRLPIGSRLASPPWSSAIVCAGRCTTRSARAGTRPSGWAVKTAVRAPASAATPDERVHGREPARPRAHEQQVAAPERRGRHVADDVRVQAEVHEPHAERLDHQPLAADAVARDAPRAADLAAQALDVAGRDAIEHGADLLERAPCHRVEVGVRHAPAGLQSGLITPSSTISSVRSYTARQRANSSQVGLVRRRARARRCARSACRRPSSATLPARPAPTAAYMAAPSAVDSRARGTCTGTPSTSARICGHRRPFAAPPVKTTSRQRAAGELSDDLVVAEGGVGRGLLDRPDALLLAAAGRGRRCRSRGSQGAVCTQRFASITFENRPTTPFAPGGTDIAASSMSS